MGGIKSSLLEENVTLREEKEIALSELSYNRLTFPPGTLRQRQKSKLRVF
jgi:hypothetical protein